MSIENLESSIRPLITTESGTDLCGVVLQNDEQLRVSPLRPFAPSERPSVEMTLVF